MSFVISLLIGFSIGLIGLRKAFAQPGELGAMTASIQMLVFAPVGVPLIGGVIHFFGRWLIVETYTEVSLTAWQRIGRSAIVAGGLFLGSVLGLIVGLAPKE